MGWTMMKSARQTAGLLALTALYAPQPCTAEPLLTTWFTNKVGVYARVYTNTAKRTSGQSRTTWPGQGTNVYADITEISYSTTSVYVHCSGLPSYVMGPWLAPGGGVGTLWPKNQATIQRFPRTPAIKGGTKTSVPAGLSGMYVNGVAIFNPLDGKAWTGSALVNSQHFATNYFWHANAPVNESYNFDYAMGHQPPNGVHHTHQNPLGLRYDLGDHVDYDTSTKEYTESTNAVTAHSPILGWSLDGYPVYGPYGYSNPTNAASGVRRMVSGYILRDGTGGADHVTNNLFTIPAWYARYRQDLGAVYSTNAPIARPATNSTYPLGVFAQDWLYQADLGRTQGVTTNFDLDVYNGRTCVTPDYTNGTYAYFVTLDSSSNSAYPYVFAFQYYGVKSGASVASVPGVVATTFLGGASTPLDFSASTSSTSTTMTLVWTATEGGSYVVESSTDMFTWSVVSGGVNATFNSGSVTRAFTTQEFYRVTRTNLTEYDP